MPAQITLPNSTTHINRQNHRINCIIDAGFDIYDPNLNAREAYIKHLETQNAEFRASQAETHDELTQVNRVNFALVAIMFVAAFSIVITLTV